MNQVDEWLWWAIAAAAGWFRAVEWAQGRRDDVEGWAALIILSSVAGIALGQAHTVHDFVRAFAALIGVYKLSKIASAPLAGLYVRRKARQQK